MKVIKGIDTWCLMPETLEEMIIFEHYLNDKPKISFVWDKFTSVTDKDYEPQNKIEKITGITEFAYLQLTFDPDENKENL